jgi:hypothetical protein
MICSDDKYSVDQHEAHFTLTSDTRGMITYTRVSLSN